MIRLLMTLLLGGGRPGLSLADEIGLRVGVHAATRVKWALTSGWRYWAPFWWLVSWMSGAPVGYGIFWGLLTVLLWGRWVMARRHAAEVEAYRVESLTSGFDPSVHHLTLTLRQTWPEVMYRCGLTYSETRASGLDLLDLARNRYMGRQLDRRVVTTREAMLGDAATREVPLLIDFDPIRGGVRIEVEMLPGQTVGVWQDAAEKLAAAWRVVSVRAEESYPGNVALRVLGTDVLADVITMNDAMASGMVPLPSWEGGVCVGVTESGAPAMVHLSETSVLIGGNPRQGKSVLLTALLSQAAMMDHCAIIGLDPKRVELAPWRPRASRVETDPEAMTTVLQWLVDEMERRYQVLEAAESEKVRELTAETPLLLVVVDEMAELTAVGVTKEEKAAEAERAMLLRRLVAKGGAAAIVLVGATQKPDSTVIPTGLRDLFDQRIALRTGNRESTRVIMGDGGDDAPAHTIKSKGIAYLVGGGRPEPERIRTFLVTKDDARTNAANSAYKRVSIPALESAGAQVID